jgi:hypothetical protein
MINLNICEVGTVTVKTNSNKETVNTKESIPANGQDSTAGKESTERKS